MYNSLRLNIHHYFALLASGKSARLSLSAKMANPAIAALQKSSHLLGKGHLSFMRAMYSPGFREFRTVSEQMKPPSLPRVFSNRGHRELETSEKVEEETLPHYLAERYYPVRIGEVFQSRYQVLTKLGFGSASTIWLCRDLREHCYLLLKVHVRSKKELPEIAVVEHLREQQQHPPDPGQQFVRLITDWFELVGPHGTHTGLLYPPAGLDMSDCMQCFSGEKLPVPLVRAVTRNILLALDYLHQADIIHTDVQPNNILAGVNDPETELSILENDEMSSPSPRKFYEDRTIYLSRPMFLTKGEPVLSDLGEARLGKSHRGVIMPSIYRAPEVMLDLEWDKKVDIWGLGQTIWTMLEGTHIFRNGSVGNLEKMHRFAEMTALLGAPPESFRKHSEECAKYWDDNGNWKGATSLPDRTLDSREQQLDGEEKLQFLRLMRKKLAWMPEERPSAEELLYDDWVRGEDY